MTSATPEVKICGLTRPQDAASADRAGADYVGVILAEGFGRSVGVERAREILAEVRRAVAVTVRVDDEPTRVLDEAERLGAGVVQLHGDESPDVAARLREASGLRVWKAVRVRTVNDLAQAAGRFQGAVDGLLLDGWHPERVGGTGTRFSWTDVARARSGIPDGMTLIAAGGLDPHNVAEAVRVLAPDVVDVSSGVESAPGVKDHGAIAAFIAAAKANGNSTAGSGDE